MWLKNANTFISYVFRDAIVSYNLDNNRNEIIRIYQLLNANILSYHRTQWRLGN